MSIMNTHTVQPSLNLPIVNSLSHLLSLSLSIYIHILASFICKYVADIRTHHSQIFQHVSQKNKAVFLLNHDTIVTLKKSNINNNNMIELIYTQIISIVTVMSLTVS